MNYSFCFCDLQQVIYKFKNHSNDEILKNMLSDLHDRNFQNYFTIILQIRDKFIDLHN